MMQLKTDPLPQLQNKLVKKRGKMKKMMVQTWKQWACLWRNGEDEPEGDPEEWVDRVADEAEEKRLQKMQALRR